MAVNGDALTSRNIFMNKHFLVTALRFAETGVTNFYAFTKRYLATDRFTVGCARFDELPSCVERIQRLL